MTNDYHNFVRALLSGLKYEVFDVEFLNIKIIKRLFENAHTKYGEISENSIYFFKYFFLLGFSQNQHSKHIV
jgi:hypothetical protein